LLLAAAGSAALGQKPEPANLTPLPFPEIDTPSLLQSGMSLWLIAGGAVLLLLLVALIVILLVRTSGAKPAPPPLPPLRRALQRLEHLQAQLADLSPDQAGHEVSVILREYQQSRYQVPAPYLTTEELYGRNAYPTEEMRERYGPLAHVYDRLSFGRIPGDRDEAAALIGLAIGALSEERRYVHDSDSDSILPESFQFPAPQDAPKLPSELEKPDRPHP
ncbi:MAG: hypothetical protein ACAI34_17330, partial [Verrucomicrobium sp.]